LCHYVYEVELQSGEFLVARLATPETRARLAGGVYWHERLCVLGVPLAPQRQGDLGSAPPFVILDRLPGEDLGNVYTALTAREKRSIAAAVVEAQLRVARLPEAHGFGHALSFADPILRRQTSWRLVIEFVCGD